MISICNVKRWYLLDSTIKTKYQYVIHNLTICIVEDYINISATDYERSLREVTLNIVNWDTCNEAIENAPEKSTYKLTGNMICAGGGTDHDACQVCLLFKSQGNSTVLFSYLVRYQFFF